MIQPDISNDMAALEARLGDLTTQRAAHTARIAAIDAALPELRDLVGEVSDRIEAQKAEVARRRVAAGNLISFGSRHNERTVTITDGRGTHILSGPRPLDTAEGQADHAERVLEALQAEGQPVRVALNDLERERHELARLAGLLGGEIAGTEQQIERLRARTVETEALLGERLTWRDRLAGILRRLGLASVGQQPGTAPSVQELRAQGKTVREIAALTGISKSQVQRELTAAGVPLGTDDLAEGA